MPARFDSCLCQGEVLHRRLRPFGHEFRYRLFWLYHDIDEIAAIVRRIPWFSHNRFNLVSFHDRDHGAGDGRPLRPWLEQRLRGAGSPQPSEAPGFSAFRGCSAMSSTR